MYHPACPESWARQASKQSLSLEMVSKEDEPEKLDGVAAGIMAASILAPVCAMTTVGYLAQYISENTGLDAAAVGLGLVTTYILFALIVIALHRQARLFAIGLARTLESYRMWFLSGAGILIVCAIAFVWIRWQSPSPVTAHEVPENEKLDAVSELPGAIDRARRRARLKHLHDKRFELDYPFVLSETRTFLHVDILDSYYGVVAKANPYKGKDSEFCFGFIPDGEIMLRSHIPRYARFWSKKQWDDNWVERALTVKEGGTGSTSKERHLFSVEDYVPDGCGDGEPYWVRYYLFMPGSPEDPLEVNTFNLKKVSNEDEVCIYVSSSRSERFALFFPEGDSLGSYSIVDPLEMKTFGQGTAPNWGELFRDPLLSEHIWEPWPSPGNVFCNPRNTKAAVRIRTEIPQKLPIVGVLLTERE